MANKKNAFAQVVELEENKLMLVTVLNKNQMEALYSLIEPKSRSWRGQYQAMGKALVNAYHAWKAR